MTVTPASLADEPNEKKNLFLQSFILQSRVHAPGRMRQTGPGEEDWRGKPAPS